MLARFTQLDYDRELALVALHGGEFVAVGRYAPNPDGETAEFALWSPMRGRAAPRADPPGAAAREARKAGYKALYGNIWRPITKCSSSRGGWGSPRRAATAPM